MLKSIFALGLTASALGAVAVSAQMTPVQGAAAGEPHHRGGGMMARMDTNHDGMITRAEVVAQADARFARVDANQDGQISVDEVQKMRQAMRDRMTASGRTRPAGAEGRGHKQWGTGATPGRAPVTKVEAEQRALKRFDRMDANHDGKIDQAELANLRELRRDRHRERQAGGETSPIAPNGGQ